MEETENLRVLDVDYIFDNFEQICEVEFGSKASKIKGPAIVRNLSSTFDRVADSKFLSEKTQTDAAETDTTGKRAKSKSKQRLAKASIEKSSIREGSKNQTLRKKLRLNLEDLFSTEAGSKPNHTVLESTRNKPLDYSTKANLIKFMRTKVVGLNQSQLPKPVQRKPSVTKPAKKQGTIKGIHSAKDQLKVDNVFGFPRPIVMHQGTSSYAAGPPIIQSEISKITPDLRKQINGVTKNIKQSSSKQSFGALEGNPLTGSTRIHTTSRQGSANHRSRSLLDTDHKHQFLAQSCRNLHAKEDTQLAFPFHAPQQQHHQQSHSQAFPGHQAGGMSTEQMPNIQIFSTHNPQQPFTVNITPLQGMPGTPDGSSHPANKMNVSLAYPGTKSQTFGCSGSMAAKCYPTTPSGTKLGMFASKKAKNVTEGTQQSRALSGGTLRNKSKTKKVKRRGEGSTVVTTDKAVTSVLGISTDGHPKKISASLHLTSSTNQPGQYPQKERSNSKGKYYIPAPLRFKSTSRVAGNESQKNVLNSFTMHDETNHQQSKSSYLYKVMFPKMVSKGLAAAEAISIKPSHSAAKKKGTSASSKDKYMTSIGNIIMNLSKKKPGSQASKIT